MKCRVMLYETYGDKKYLGEGLADVEDNSIKLEFNEEEVAWLSLKVPEALFYSKLPIPDLAMLIKQEERVQIPSHPEYSIKVLLPSDYN